MSNIVRCSYCRRRLKVEREQPGDPITCPTCGKTSPAAPDEPLPGEDDRDLDIRRSRRGGALRPGKVQAVSIMVLVGGIWGIVYGVSLLLGLGIGTCGLGCLWPGSYYSIVMGILATMKGSKLLGQQAHFEDPPRNAAILMIINIVNFDLVCLTLGILTLVFLSDPEVEDFFRGSEEVE